MSITQDYTTSHSTADSYQNCVALYTKSKSSKTNSHCSSHGLSDIGLVYVSAIGDKSQPGHELYDIVSYSLHYITTGFP